MVYTANWVIIYHLPPIKGTRNSYWFYSSVFYGCKPYWYNFSEIIYIKNSTSKHLKEKALSIHFDQITSPSATRIFEAICVYMRDSEIQRWNLVYLNVVNPLLVTSCSYSVYTYTHTHMSHLYINYMIKWYKVYIDISSIHRFNPP